MTQIASLMQPSATADAAETARPNPTLARPTLLGLRRSALIELALFMLLAIGADQLLLDGARFAGISPHPFWLIVILLALQYGVNEGLVAAGAATIVLVAGGLPERGFGQDLYDYLALVSREPILWCLAAVLIGEVRSRQIRDQRALERALDEATSETAVLGAAYERTSDAKNQLEQRLAAELRTTMTVFEGARAVDRQNVGEVLMGVGDLVRATIAARKFSVFLLNANALEAALNEGWAADDRFASFFAADTGIFEAIVGRQALLAAPRADDALLLARDGVLAGPLVNGEDGAVVGMLKIEDMSFIDLNPTTIETFRMLCAWIGSAIAQAQTRERLAEERLGTDVPEVLSASLLDHQRRFVADLGRRLGFESTLIRIFRDDAHLAPAAERAELADAIGIGVSRALRRTDLAFEHGRHGRTYAVVLAGTAPTDADAVVEKLRHEIQAALPPTMQDVPLRFTLGPCLDGGRP